MDLYLSNAESTSERKQPLDMPTYLREQQADWKSAEDHSTKTRGRSNNDPASFRLRVVVSTSTFKASEKHESGKRRCFAVRKFVKSSLGPSPCCIRSSALQPCEPETDCPPNTYPELEPLKENSSSRLEGGISFQAGKSTENTPSQSDSALFERLAFKAEAIGFSPIKLSYYRSAKSFPAPVSEIDDTLLRPICTSQGREVIQTRHISKQSSLSAVFIIVFVYGLIIRDR
jgi:hypothetical protein